jgi:uncharacterized membrane protein YdjX (TVP38/TMEM64 family)
MRSWLRWLVLAVIVAGIGAFYGFGWDQHFSFTSIRASVGELRGEVDNQFILAASIFFVLYAVLTALSVPAAWILTLVAGALFGRMFGSALALLAATVGATLAFLSSRFLFWDWVQAHFGQRLDAFNRGFEKDGAFYLFSLRLVPIFPFFLINLGMGLTPIRTWTYFWVSLIGMLPGSILYANAGYELGTLESPSDILSPGVIVSLVLLGIAPLVFRKVMQWTRRAEPEA